MKKAKMVGNEQNLSETSNQRENVLSKQKIKKPINWAKAFFVWGWMALPLISWLIFYWYQNIQSILGSFQIMDPDNFMQYTWSFDNYVKIWKEITAGEEKLDSLRVGFENTLKYWLVNYTIDFPRNILICYFLYKRVWGYKTLRFIFFMPMVIPSIAYASVFKDIVSYGGVLSSLGFEIPEMGLLGTAATATNTMVVYQIWMSIGGNMLLVCGAMNRIPAEVLEAARVDGVTPWIELIKLIIPLIWPTLSTLLLMGCCSFLTASGPVLLLAPDSSTLRSTTISYWLFTKVWAGGAHMQGQYNLVSAAGLILTAVAFPVVLFVRWLLDKFPSVEY